ncbi:MAG: DesA family fatty acid desaturase [Endozoicomonas sp.]|uniref:DesA family fatty acid desaturase n=1 Tax=Endozoicomonas sp. TaxID=1892382 RepID=UPI003D9AB80B
MWYEGLLSPSLWEAVLVTLLLTHITILSVTIYLHRFSAHNALELHPILQHLFRFWLWLTTGMRTLEWTAIHRKHHAFCETDSDPHSPVRKGLGKVLWQGAELYRQEAQNQETLQRYGQRTPDDWIERKLYTPYTKAGIVLMLTIDLLLFGTLGISIWAVQMLWIPLFAAGVINGLGHHSGYRNFECKDAARNLFPIGLLIGGEELHNNHHTFPNSPKLSVRKWEFDIGWLWIRFFGFLNLAHVRKVNPLAKMDFEKNHIDSDTVMAVINNRFQIMVQYKKMVIAPMVRDEKSRACAQTRRLFNSARKLLARENSLLIPDHKERVQKILDTSQVLNTIYEKKNDLQAIWNTIKDKNERIEALINWCHESEESGIKALQDFSRLLKSHTLPNTSAI